MSAINCSDRSAHADMIKFHQSDSDLASSYRLSLPIPVWTSIQLSVMPYSHSWRKMCLKKSLIITSQFFKSAHKRWRKKRKKNRALASQQQGARATERKSNLHRTLSCCCCCRSISSPPHRSAARGIKKSVESSGGSFQFLMRECPGHRCSPSSRRYDIIFNEKNNHFRVFLSLNRVALRK